MATQYGSLKTVVTLGLLLVVLLCSWTDADDSANFFLKASKSVPRIGRRSDFFTKTQKSVPRIGRRRTMAPLTENQEWGVWPWYRSSESTQGPSKRTDNDFFYIRKDGQPVMWTDLARDMEENPEMWVPAAWPRVNQDDDF